MRRLLATVFVATLLVGVACGRETVTNKRPAEVPNEIVPSALKSQGGDLKFYKSEIPGVQEAFADAGAESLVADGQLWELRAGDRLVGTLQLTTLDPEVDLEQKKWRDQIRKRAIPTATDRLTVSDVPVWTNTSQDRHVYLWFGRDIMAILVVKGREEQVDPETVVNEVVESMTTSDKWKPLFIEEELDE